mmetsp:Transcript_27162/g.68530  ORF Transcript_27162/g.68530 Transcript_27162/m.68530 type:complete len:90 (+) Transcript_27162:426-695(+)
MSKCKWNMKSYSVGTRKKELHLQLQSCEDEQLKESERPLSERREAGDSAIDGPPAGLAPDSARTCSAPQPGNGRVIWSVSLPRRDRPAR